MQLRKFPRIVHHPLSESISSDDNWLFTDDHFYDMNQIIVTEKLDGENTTLTREKIHARSLDSMHMFARHPSRTWVKRLHAEVQCKIPAYVRICGESVYAQHKIPYNRLPSYFLVFATFEEIDGISYCHDWLTTEDICDELELYTVPVWHIGQYREYTVSLFAGKISSLGKEKAEGFVIRNGDKFKKEDFGRNCAKWVVRGHHQS